MWPRLAKTYVVLSAAILVIVGVAGFFRHEMFNLTFPPAHNLFHLGSGVIGLWAGLGKSPNGPRQFGLVFGTIYLLLSLAGFAGLRDLGSIALGLNNHYNVIHLGIGLLSLTAGFLTAKSPATPSASLPPTSGSKVTHHPGDYRQLTTPILVLTIPTEFHFQNCQPGSIAHDTRVI